MHPEGVGEYFHQQGYRRKEGHYLDVEQVIQIFAMLSCDVPVYQIGAHFGVSSQMVYHIKNGTRWSWVRDKLLEETEKVDLRHRWIPAEGREGTFVCGDCGTRYNSLMMFTRCPVREKNDDLPIYLSWQVPEAPKPKRGKTSIPGADLNKVRAYKEKERKLQAKHQAKLDAKQAKKNAKELRRQELLRQVDELRRRETMAKMAEGLNFSRA